MSGCYVVRIRYDVDAYVNKGCVAVGWGSVDFSKYRNRPADELWARVKEVCYPNNDTPNTILGRKRNEIARFMGIQKGDIIVVPGNHVFYIGYATDALCYDETSENSDLRNHLAVDFLKDPTGKPIAFTRSGKSTALQTKLGVRGFTVLEIKNESLIKEVTDIATRKIDRSQDADVALQDSLYMEDFAREIKRVLSDYSKAALDANGAGFEGLIKLLMESGGYKAIRLTTRVGGSEVADADVFAYNAPLLSPEFTTACFIQAKHYKGTSNDGINQIIDFKRLIDDGSLKPIVSDDGTTIVADSDISALVVTSSTDSTGKHIMIPFENIKYYVISSGDFYEDGVFLAAKNGIVLINGEQLARIIADKIEDIPEVRHKLGFVKKYEHIKPDVQESENN